MKPAKRYFLLAAALSAVWLVGCSTPATRIKHNPDAFARLNPDQQALVKTGQVGLGMDMAAVELAVGKPDRITVRTNAEEQTQIWRYVDSYAYDDSGFLYSAHYGGWGGGGWGGRGGYYGHGYWGGGYFGSDLYRGRPLQESNRLLIEFKNSIVSSIVQGKEALSGCAVRGIPPVSSHS